MNLETVCNGKSGGCREGFEKLRVSDFKKL